MTPPSAATPHHPLTRELPLKGKPFIPAPPLRYLKGKPFTTYADRMNDTIVKLTFVSVFISTLSVTLRVPPPPEWEARVVLPSSN